MTEDPKLAAAELVAPTIDFQAYLFPDETEAEYDEFTQPIIDELSPSSALQRRIAANIADLEWEAMRYRRLTSQTMGDGYSHSAKTALSNLQRENTITGGDVGKIMKSLRSSDESARKKPLMSWKHWGSATVNLWHARMEGENSYYVT